MTSFQQQFRQYHQEQKPIEQEPRSYKILGMEVDETTAKQVMALENLKNSNVLSDKDFQKNVQELLFTKIAEQTESLADKKLRYINDRLTTEAALKEGGFMEDSDLYKQSMQAIDEKHSEVVQSISAEKEAQKASSPKSYDDLQKQKRITDLEAKIEDNSISKKEFDEYNFLQENPELKLSDLGSQYKYDRKEGKFTERIPGTSFSDRWNTTVSAYDPWFIKRMSKGISKYAPEPVKREIGNFMNIFSGKQPEPEVQGSSQLPESFKRPLDDGVGSPINSGYRA